MEEDYEEVTMMCTTCRTKVVMPKEVFDRIQKPTDDVRNIPNKLNEAGICCELAGYGHPSFVFMPEDDKKK